MLWSKGERPFDEFHRPLSQVAPSVEMVHQSLLLCKAESLFPHPGSGGEAHRRLNKKTIVHEKKSIVQEDKYFAPNLSCPAEYIDTCELARQNK